MTGAGLPPRDYMAGSCHVFALALHRARGWGFLLLLDCTEQYGDVYAVHHVYALDGQGGAWDLLGRHDETDVVKQWKTPECSMSWPDTEYLESEDELQRYVEPTADGWSRPLDAYTERDVADAMTAAAKMLRRAGRPRSGTPGDSVMDGAGATPQP